MPASKTLTYMNVSDFALYLTELAKLGRRQAGRLGKRGITEGVIRELQQTSEALREAVTAHLTARGTKNAESAEQHAAREALHGWMSTIKQGAKMAFRGDPQLFTVAHHDLRIGVSYHPKRVSAVLAEAMAMLPGVQKHRARLLTCLTPGEVDGGKALLEALNARLGSRMAALNDQREKQYERNQLHERGRALARLVLEGVALEFRSEAEEPVRALFFGLDKRMAKAARSGGSTAGGSA